MRALAILGLVLAVVLPVDAQAQAFRVLIVPGLEIADLERLESRGAVGLLVPGAGPETSARAARASLARGEVRNSLRDGIPTGRSLISVELGAVPAGGGPAIVLSLPSGGVQPNDRRYPIAVLGRSYRGLLTSESTRIRGLVSVADVAPTALGETDALGSEPGGAAELEVLDRRIDANNDARKTASRLAALLLLVLAAAAPRAAVLGAATLLLVNLALGIVGPDSEWLLIASLAIAVAVGGPAAAAVIRSETRIGTVLVAVLAAYLVAFLADERWVALSPLGPTQNARFYGLSNVLETILLLPAFAAGALLGRRSLVLLAAVATLAFVVVVGSRFGADGGGAVVLAVGFGVLAAALSGLRGRRLVATVVAALGLVLAFLAFEAATGATSHVTRALEGGPSSLASDLRDRVELSYARATDHWQSAVILLGGIVLIAALAVRALRSKIPLRERALPVALLAALATSLVVNDSPVDVVVIGLACYVAAEAYALRAAPLGRSSIVVPGSERGRALGDRRAE